MSFRSLPCPWVVVCLRLRRRCRTDKAVAAAEGWGYRTLGLDLTGSADPVLRSCGVVAGPCECVGDTENIPVREEQW